MKFPQTRQHRLRIGRHSSPGQIYLITCVTRNRLPLFENLLPARSVVQCLKYADTARWTRTYAYVLMPDHLHWLFELGHSKTLAGVIQSIKGYSSRQLVRIGYGCAPVWQAGFHDHALRAEEDLREVSRYIVANPVRAGLCKEIGAFPHWAAVWMEEFIPAVD